MPRRVLHTPFSASCAIRSPEVLIVGTGTYTGDLLAPEVLTCCLLAGQDMTASLGFHNTSMGRFFMSLDRKWLSSWPECEPCQRNPWLGPRIGSLTLTAPWGWRQWQPPTSGAWRPRVLIYFLLIVHVNQICIIRMTMLERPMSDGKYSH